MIKYKIAYLYIDGETVYILDGWNSPQYLALNKFWRSICWVLARIARGPRTYPVKDFVVGQMFPELKEIWPKLVEVSQFYTIRVTVSQPLNWEKGCPYNRL